MNRHVIPVECGGCWAEAVGVPAQGVRPARPAGVRQAPYANGWPLPSLGVASLGHCSSRLLGDLFSLAVGFLTFLAHRLDFLTRLLAFLTHLLAFLIHLLAFLTHRLDFLTRLIAFLTFLPISKDRYFRIGLPAP